MVMSKGKKRLGLLSPGKATEELRKKAKAKNFNILWTKHAKEQMKERGLIMGDIKHLLKEGFVYDEGIESTKAGYFKYAIESKTPNSNARTVKAIVIPDFKNEIKVVTVMWKDEKRQGN